MKQVASSFLLNAFLQLLCYASTINAGFNGVFIAVYVLIVLTMLASAAALMFLPMDEVKEIVIKKPIDAKAVRITKTGFFLSTLFVLSYFGGWWYAVIYGALVMLSVGIFKATRENIFGTEE